MQQQIKKFFSFISIIIVVFLSGCEAKENSIVGFWENEYKIIEFNTDYFIIYNKQSEDIIAFYGSYTFAREPRYALKMTYKEAMISSGLWESLIGTELENYTDILLVKIENDFLETKVLGNGQRYTYRRIQNPMSTDK